MIPFIQLPYRRAEDTERKHGMRPLVVALILGLILCFQLGLVLWVFCQQWHR